MELLKTGENGKRRIEVLLLVAALVAAGVSLAPTEASAASNGSSEASAGSSEGGILKNLTVGAGLRVGGYGFRQSSDGALSWNDCRMNGVGVFGTVDFGDHLFVELSADVYHATGKTVSNGMDRLSLHTLASVGARMFPDFIVSPYLQVGVGPEFTKGSVGDRSFRKVLVAPFLGVGGEVKISQLRLGANIRSFVMGVPDHGSAGDGSGDGKTHAHGATGGGGLLKYEVAGQAQFFARYVF